MTITVNHVVTRTTHEWSSATNADWYHFECVSVDQDVADRDWLCPTCQPIRGAIPKGFVSTASARLPVCTQTSASNPSVRVTSVPLSIVPHIPTNQFALPNACDGDTNNSMLTHVGSNRIFPPLSRTSALREVDKATVMPSTFTLASSVARCHTIAPLNPTIPSAVQASEAYPTARPTVTSQCHYLAVPSSLHQPISSIANIPLASSTIVPTIGHASNEPPRLTSDLQRNIAKQGFGDTSSQHSGSSKQSSKQLRLKLQMQMLDEERKLQEQESSVVDVEEENRDEIVDEWLNVGMNMDHVPAQHGPLPSHSQQHGMPPSTQLTKRKNPTLHRQTNSTEHQNAAFPQPDVPIQQSCVPGFSRMRIETGPSRGIHNED